MNLEENEHILENKELKTNTQKRRFIAINNTTESSFTNGLVTIIHQEQFNQLKKEHQELLELNENPITKEDLQELEEQLQVLQEEKNQLEKIRLNRDKSNNWIFDPNYEIYYKVDSNNSYCYLTPDDNSL